MYQFPVELQHQQSVYLILPSCPGKGGTGKKNQSVLSMWNWIYASLSVYSAEQMSSQIEANASEIAS